MKTTTVTNFYVAGFPDGVRKDELRLPFSRHGKVVDVYFWWKKSYQQKNYAFIRFTEVEDERALEAKLQGVKCRSKELEINISKHQRKTVTGNNGGNSIRGRRVWNGRETHQRNQATVNNGNRRITGQPCGGNRTYAQVITGDGKTQPLQKEPPIVLQSDTYMSEWIKKNVLIGEAHSLDHMGTMHYSHFVNDTTKYLGGLRVAIRFDTTVEAREFLADELRWKEWFKWLERVDQKEMTYERIAWLKITGVPLRLWGGTNFSKIARRFGKVICPFDNISTRRDYSMGKVGVITSARTWINTVATIKVEGQEFQVGVVEYTDDWSPFKPAQFDKVEESDEEEEDGGEDDDGVSDTWMADKEDEPEEGEFRPDQPPVHTPKSSPARAPMAAECENTSSPINNGKTHEESQRNVEAYTSPEKNINSVPTPDAASPLVNTAQLLSKPEQLNLEETNAASGGPQPSIGLVETLVPLGCFGPFPSDLPAMTFSFASIQAQPKTSKPRTGFRNTDPNPTQRKRKRTDIEELIELPKFDTQIHATDHIPTSETTAPLSTKTLWRLENSARDF
ncbi:hypothetical protein LXL04_005384 [Taraxacum kok-saghyz]